MDERMIEAAQTGDIINLLYELILNDPYVLERIDAVPFSHTPLHIAASAGHTEFMMEMIKLKPTFARKLNQAGFSPMHLALQNDRTKAVLRLLRFDEGLVRVCPEAIADVTVRDETVFHLAVKNDMFEAFQVLVGWLIRSRHESAERWEKELLSWVDIDGNTVLHIAAIKNRPQVVEVLLGHLRRDQINAKNLEGLTALDIQSQYPWKERQADRIIDMLSKAGGLSASSSSLPNTSISSFHIESLKEKMPWFQKLETKTGRLKNGISYEMRNTFLVVIVLLITTTYEPSLNPPKMPDDSPSMKYQVSLSQDQPLNSHTFLHKTDINTAPIPSPSAIDVSKKDYWTSNHSFLVLNMFNFSVAVLLIGLLLPYHPFSFLILLPLSCCAASYSELYASLCEFSNKNALLSCVYNFSLTMLLPFLVLASMQHKQQQTCPCKPHAEKKQHMKAAA
ncbi:hypothetical protein Gotri_004816 [Gossypium trilobum]|uniref:PGG domain-containing protein n=1 Tax=Gossypium trilobum TaxID=34281 RepID=A0A7J9F627_9ROSI|nr:hypothetical protein [Gossypium trilobum]